VSEHTYQDAARRVDDTPELEPYQETILYGWPNAGEHLAWVCAATVEEIVDWARAVAAAASGY
jgi:hypothetical protein